MGGPRNRGGTEMKKRWSWAALWLPFLLLSLTGCFFRSPEDLYQSPQRSADYLSLTQTIATVKNSLSQEYGVEVEDISVMSGSNTALIQLQDMDGDGERETAVTFFRVPEADRPLKIYFFTKSDEDTYTASAVVEGTGSSIYRVDYVDLNGNGSKEVVVSWQMNTGAYLLGAYSLEEVMDRNVQQAVAYSSSLNGAVSLPKRDALRAEEWMTTAYTDYALYDLDQDTRTEIAVIQVDPAGTNSKVEVYGWRDGAFLARDSAPLSIGIISAALGQKYYPIPYRWSRIALIFIAMLGIFWGSEWIDRLFFSDIAIGSASAGHILAKLGVHTVLIAVYIGLAYLIVRQRPVTKRKDIS